MKRIFTLILFTFTLSYSQSTDSIIRYKGKAIDISSPRTIRLYKGENKEFVKANLNKSDVYKISEENESVPHFSPQIIQNLLVYLLPICNQCFGLNNKWKSVYRALELK